MTLTRLVLLGLRLGGSKKVTLPYHRLKKSLPKSACKIFNLYAKFSTVYHVCSHESSPGNPRSWNNWCLGSV